MREGGLVCLRGVVIALASLGVALACASRAPTAHNGPPAPVAATSSARDAPDASPPAPSNDALPPWHPPEPVTPLDPEEPRLSGPVALAPWKDAPRPFAYCPPRTPLPRPRTSCTREDGLAALLFALESHTHPARKDCNSPWNDDVRNRVLQLHQSDPALKARDDALAEVESCGGLDASLVRLTRAALWLDCADALETKTPDANVAVALRGYALAAQLRRTSWFPRTARSLQPRDYVRVVSNAIEKSVDVLRKAQAAVEALPAGTHGRAVADVALADVGDRPLQFVAMVQTEDLEERRELTRQLSAKTEPYEQESRERLPVAYAAVRIASDWDLLRRTQYFDQHPERRVPQRLVLPPLPGEPSVRAVPRLAARLPSYVAARLLDVEQADAATIRSLVQSGFDPAVRRALSRNPSPEATRYLVHARLVLAARARSAADAAEAARLASTLPAEEASTSLAIARSLAEALEPAMDTEPRPTFTAVRRLDVAVDAAANPVDRAILDYDVALLARTYGVPTHPADVAKANQPLEALLPCVWQNPFYTNCFCPNIGALY